MTWKAKAGTFSKAVEGSITVNFSESGGSNCSKACTMHPDNGGACYAVVVEAMKPCVQVSGERKREQGFARTCIDIADDINKKLAKGETIPWVRLSSFGSVPNRALSNLEQLAFKQLVETLIATKAPVHFPVETESKRHRMQVLCDAVKPGAIVVRLSGQTLGKALNARNKNIATSVVFTVGNNKRERLANARVWAAKHRKSHGAMVCPAIASTIERKAQKVKCGACKACAQKQHLIIYPQH